MVRRSALLFAVWLLAVIGLGAAPASAAPPQKADLAVAVKAAQGAVNDVVPIHYTIHNLGPGAVPANAMFATVIAPGGTEFDGVMVALGRSFNECQAEIPRKKVRCRANAIAQDGQNGSPIEDSFHVTVKSFPVTPGRITLEYANDPKPLNNAALITIKVDASPSPSVKPSSASPTPSPTPSRTPASTDSAQAPPPVPTDTADTTPTADTAVATKPVDSGGSLLPTALIAGGLLVAGAVGLMLWLVLRRNTDDSPAEDDQPLIFPSA